MASTRNKNLKLGYDLEQRKYKESRDIIDYKYKYKNPAPAYPGLGFTPTQIPASDISYNPVTIESQLFGIGANNLVNPRNTEKPDYKNMDFLTLIPQTKTVLPKDFVLDKYQRPLP
tara:strand:+ start:126 stop:473 length:348 start_codon:yes stop_codon:yes gene_type:complete